MRAAALAPALALPLACFPADTGEGPDAAADAAVIDATPGGADAATDAQSEACLDPGQPGCGCDPSGELPATELLVDDLAAEGGQVRPAPGFDEDAWVFQGGAYRQTADLAPERVDASLFELEAPPPGDVLVELTAASTAVEDFGDDLRQLVVTAGTEAAAESYSAVGCGIELAQNGDLIRTVSVVSLSGPPGDVDTERRETRDYGGVSLDEEFSIRMELVGDSVVCRVVAGGEATFVKADGFDVPAGEVGLFTRENQASFRDVAICGLP